MPITDSSEIESDNLVMHPFFKYIWKAKILIIMKTKATPFMFTNWKKVIIIALLEFTKSDMVMLFTWLPYVQN